MLNLQCAKEAYFSSKWNGIVIILNIMGYWIGRIEWIGTHANRFRIVSYYDCLPSSIQRNCNGKSSWHCNCYRKSWRIHRPLFRKRNQISTEIDIHSIFLKYISLYRINTRLYCFRIRNPTVAGLVGQSSALLQISGCKSQDWHWN